MKTTGGQKSHWTVPLRCVLSLADTVQLVNWISVPVREINLQLDQHRLGGDVGSTRML